MARRRRVPGDFVADLALFGPIVASGILAALGHDTTSTRIRSSWRRWFLCYLALHGVHTWRWDPLARLDRAVRSTDPLGRAVILHSMHRPTASSSLGRLGAGAVPLSPPQAGGIPVKSGVAERRTTP